MGMIVVESKSPSIQTWLKPAASTASTTLFTVDVVRTVGIRSQSERVSTATLSIQATSIRAQTVLNSSASERNRTSVLSLSESLIPPHSATSLSAHAAEVSVSKSAQEASIALYTASAFSD